MPRCQARTVCHFGLPVYMCAGENLLQGSGPIQPEMGASKIWQIYFGWHRRADLNKLRDLRRPAAHSACFDLPGSAMLSQQDSSRSDLDGWLCAR